MNTSYDSPPAAAPKRSSLARLFPISNFSGQARVYQSGLFRDRPIHHHLLIPTLTPPRSPREDDLEDDSSVESFANFSPHISLKPRWNPVARNDGCISPFLDFTPTPSPLPAPKEKNLASETKYLGESFTTLESTWCLSDPDKHSHDDCDESLNDYSIDDEVQELTMISHRVRSARPIPSNGFDGEFSSATIPTHIVVPED